MTASISPLISRVLACPEVGDRSLDADIAEAMGQVPEGHHRSGDGYVRSGYAKEWQHFYPFPRYTTSLDAVEALHKSALPGWMMVDVVYYTDEVIVSMANVAPIKCVSAAHPRELNARLAAVLKAKEQERR